MSKITYQARERMPKSTFAEPKTRKYPIPDLSHARNALARVSGNGSSLEKEMVRREVARRFPQIKQAKGAQKK